MSLNKIVTPVIQQARKGANKIASSSAMQRIKKGATRITENIGDKVDVVVSGTAKKDNFWKKIIKAYEPNGVDNSFFGMATLMLGAVLAPRIVTAAKRNPDNKEATKDEMMEILFRDVTTILTMLFGLKALKAGISGITSKLNGLPMTNKPYQKLFQTQTTGFKGIQEKAQEFIQHPIDKIKIISKNIVDTLNPLGGVASLSKEQFTSRYANYASADEIRKLFQDIANQGGEGVNQKGAKKVYNKLMKNLIKNQEELISHQGKLANAGISQVADENEATKILARLKELKEKGLDGLQALISKEGKTDAQVAIDSKISRQLVDFFADDKNAIVNDALRLDGALKTGALAIEASFLGFGLPALNQKRLERKYLKDNKTNPQQETMLAFNPLVDRNIKAQEIKIFSNFIK